MNKSSGLASVMPSQPLKHVFIAIEIINETLLNAPIQQQTSPFF